MFNRKTYYISDKRLIRECDRLPAVKGRAVMVHRLITSYGLLLRLQLFDSVPASYNEMRQFHSESYLEHIKRHETVDNDYVPDMEDEQYGLAYDSPPVSKMYQLISILAGGTISAAAHLLDGKADVAINWCGGWHHAQRDAARGFCYINDVVLGIIKLQEKFRKILYVDLDTHHGDGVQDAFYTKNTVFTLSFHKYEPGFYPGTGNIDEIGSSTGRGYNCNFPFNDGYTDSSMNYVFKRVFNKVYNKFKPDALVIQCGADALANDPHGGAGLTCKSYVRSVRIVLNKRKPTLLLGGGGYTHENVARLWTSLLALSVNVRLKRRIPAHKNRPYYGPNYTLTVHNTNATDLNTPGYLDMCVKTIENNLKIVNRLNEPQPHCSRDEPQAHCSRDEPQANCSRDEPQANCSRDEPQANCSRDEPQAHCSQDEDGPKPPKLYRIFRSKQTKDNLKIVHRLNEPQPHCSRDEPQANCSRDEPQANCSQDEDGPKPPKLYRIFRSKQTKGKKQPELPKPNMDHDVYEFDE